MDFVDVVGERSRTYLYKNDVRLALTGVTKVCVRPNGDHRLELASGKKVVVTAGFLAVELDSDAWTV